MTEGKQVKRSCHLAKLEFPKWLWLKMSFLHRHSSHAINHPFFQSCWSYTRYYANTAKQKAEFKTKKLRTENYPTVFHSKLKILLLNFIITFFVSLCATQCLQVLFTPVYKLTKTSTQVEYWKSLLNYWLLWYKHSQKQAWTIAWDKAMEQSLIFSSPVFAIPFRFAWDWPTSSEVSQRNDGKGQH